MSLCSARSSATSIVFIQIIVASLRLWPYPVIARLLYAVNTNSTCEASCHGLPFWLARAPLIASPAEDASVRSRVAAVGPSDPAAWLAAPCVHHPQIRRRYTYCLSPDDAWWNPISSEMKRWITNWSSAKTRQNQRLSLVTSPCDHLIRSPAHARTFSLFSRFIHLRTHTSLTS